MKNKQVFEIVQINKDYEYLMSFIGLGEVTTPFGITTTENELDALDCLFYSHLNEDESKRLSMHVKELKDGIDLLMDVMQRKVNKML